MYPATAGSDIDTLLSMGRSSLRKGDDDASREAFRSVVLADPAVLHRPWGLIPRLKARGESRLRDRLIERREIWHRGDPPPEVQDLVKLVNKRHLRTWAAKNGFAVPRQIAFAERTELLDWPSLPGNVVIKPDNAASNAGVVVAVDGIDRMTGQEIGPTLADHVVRRWTEDGIQSACIIAEEFVQDIADRETCNRHRIPRDFKVFAVRGLAGAVRVLDRNAPSGKRSRITLDRDGNLIDDPMPDWPEAGNGAVPRGFETVVSEAERLSRQFSWLLRFDFYLTPKGPLLGEITTFPNAGLGFRGQMRRLLLQMWHLEPDPPRLASHLPGIANATDVSRTR